MKKNLRLCFASSLVLAACGEEDSAPVARARPIEALMTVSDGTYLLSSLVCSEGDLSPNYRNLLDLISLKMTFNAEDFTEEITLKQTHCIRTETGKLSTRSKTSTTLTTNDIQCSPECSERECNKETLGKTQQLSYSFDGKVLRHALKAGDACGTSGAQLFLDYLKQ